MKKVVLFFGRPDPYRDYWWPPFNLLFLSALFVKKGYKVKIIDEQIEPNYKEKLVREARDALLVGFTTYTGHQIGCNIKAVKVLREKLPEVPVVWGGSHASALPEQTLRSGFVDVVVIGQGEFALFGVAESIRKGTPLDDVLGIGFKRGGKPVFTQKREYYDINLVPRLPFELIDWGKYINPETRMLDYTSSWGCSNWCTFCYWAGKHFWSGFPAKRTVDDLEHLVRKQKAGMIRLLDSDFFTDRERAVAIARAILKRGLEFTWFVNVRIDSAVQYNKREWDLFYKAGLRSIFIGLESASPRILRLMNKNNNLEEMVKLAARLKGSPIKIYLSLMFGLPTEELEDLQLTHDFYQRLLKENPKIWRQVCIFEPLPATPLTMLAERKGFRLPKTLGGWVKYGYKSAGFNGRPWFSDKFNKEYKKRLYELFPESDAYKTQFDDRVKEKETG